MIKEGSHELAPEVTYKNRVNDADENHGSNDEEEEMGETRGGDHYNAGGDDEEVDMDTSGGGPGDGDYNYGDEGCDYLENETW